MLLDKKLQNSIIIGPKEPIPEEQHVFVLRREAIDLANRFIVTRSLLTSPGEVRVACRIWNTAILGGNDVSVQDFAGFMVADGNVKARRIGGLVIAKGSVECTSDIDNCVVVAGGKVECRRRQDSIIREGNPKLLGWVRFFETADAGVEVAKADNDVRVEKATPDQPPAKAGLRVGDAIISIDGTKITDPDQFRRLLRKSTTGDSTKFTVRRDGKSLDLRASFVGWEPPPSKPYKE
jgi:membrane-associated protease RseP (regulator of RpoE activity)